MTDIVDWLQENIVGLVEFQDEINSDRLMSIDHLIPEIQMTISNLKDAITEIQSLRDRVKELRDQNSRLRADLSLSEKRGTDDLIDSHLSEGGRKQRQERKARKLLEGDDG